MSQLYFIAILTPNDLTNKIRKVQEDFALNYNSSRQLKIPVHITLIPPFKADIYQIGELIQMIQDQIKFESFEMFLDGFGAFGNRVIYVNVRPNQRLNSLQTALEIETHETLLTNEITHHQFNPHITLANRDLSNDQFVKAWKKYEKLDFFGSFLVDQFLLMKHNGKVWESFHY